MTTRTSVNGTAIAEA